ncbi:MAG: hypothetical protein QM640_12535 [Niabella sp.]
MTANFSFKRLLQLISKQWIENRRMYSMSVLALLGALSITIALWLAASGKHYQEDNLYAIGLIGLFITGAIFASTSFNMLNAKDAGIYWISFPASHLEKMLVTLFFNVIVFTAAYMVCFFVLKFLAEIYIQALIDHAEYPNQYGYDKIRWDRVHGLGPSLPYFLSAFFAVQAAFVLGSASFKRFSFIATLIIIATVLLLTIFFIAKLSKSMISRGYYFELTTVSSKDVVNGTYKQYAINGYLKIFIEVFLYYLLAPFLWVVTWFKLKEKEM